MGQADRALEYEEQARAFYQNAGYLTETSQSFLARGRALQMKGDYAAALQAFQEQLQLSEKIGDQSQIAYAHVTLGNLLLDKESYDEARQHFDTAYTAFDSMGNQLNKGYALMSRGAAYWRLGSYDKAHADLDAASAIARQEGSSFRELQAFINLVEAQMALGERRFPEAAAKSQEAINLAGEQNKLVAARGKYTTGLAKALSGQASGGEAACQEASDAASSLGDPLLLARTQLALAEAAFAAGDTERALASAKQAQVFFSNAGMPESEWRAWLIAGLASQKAGDSDNAQSSLSRAANLLASLEQKWGTEVFNSYLTRSDVRFYRKQLEQGSAVKR
jgi:tetratricopeptide (TPR) repeat protein